MIVSVCSYFFFILVLLVFDWFDVVLWFDFFGFVIWCMLGFWLVDGKMCVLDSWLFNCLMFDGLVVDM